MSILNIAEVKILSLVNIILVFLKCVKTCNNDLQTQCLCYWKKTPISVELLQTGWTHTPHTQTHYAHLNTSPGEGKCEKIFQEESTIYNSNVLPFGCCRITVSHESEAGKVVKLQESAERSFATEQVKGLIQGLPPFCCLHSVTWGPH